MGSCLSKNFCLKEDDNSDPNVYSEIRETGPVMTGKNSRNQEKPSLPPKSGATLPERYIKDPAVTSNPPGTARKTNRKNSRKNKKTQKEKFQKGKVFKAKFDYLARNGDELTFNEGDSLILQKKQQDSMLRMKHFQSGKIGLVHHPYVEVNEEEVAPSSDDENAIPQISDEEKILLQRQGKRVYRAVHSYAGEEENTLEVKEGDICIVSMQQDDWFLAQNYESKVHGYIPCSCVEEINSIKTFTWYHDGIPRREAERRLKQPKYPVKSFIVTERTDSIGLFTLSYKDRTSDGNIEVKHEEIKVNGFLRGDCRTVYPTLDALIDDFIDTNQAHACPKPQPSVMSLTGRRDEWEFKKEALDFEQSIGKGQFGEVYKGTWKETVPVAIKSWREEKIDQVAFHKEVSMMKELRHENLVNLLGICTEDSHYYIVTELLEKGSLKDVLKKEGNIMDLDRKIEISMRISDGMAYIESKKFVHRDLAARNVLIGAHDEVKVGDFGMTRILSEGAYEAPQDTLLPIRWCAPEIITNYKYSTKSDVWAYGITLYEIFMNGGQPYEKHGRNREVAEKIKCGVINACPPECPQYMYDTMSNCWNKKPEDRPTFYRIQEALKNAVNYDGVVFQGDLEGHVNSGFDVYEDCDVPARFQPGIYDDTGDQNDIYQDTLVDDPQMMIYDDVAPDTQKDIHEVEVEIEEEEEEVVENQCYVCKRMRKEEDIDFGIYWHRCDQCDIMYHRQCIVEESRPEDTRLETGWCCPRCY